MIARAIVSCTVEVEISGWGPDVTLAQIMNQASRKAVDVLREHLDDPGIRVAATKSVRVMIVEDEDDT